MGYDELLESAMEKMLKKESYKDRFTVPPLQVESQGTKTLIKNFLEIANAIRRTPQEISSYLFKGLATPGVLQNGMLVLQAKVSADAVQKKLDNYIRDYVYCKVCGEPDTVIVKEGKGMFMVCEACGAKGPAGTK
jgi:translation initiation factor 2 subunit 2